YIFFIFSHLFSSLFFFLLAFKLLEGIESKSIRKKGGIICLS
ncbi:hypothetical protein HMPREF1347_01138, partial [Enterococcus faecium 504]